MSFSRCFSHLSKAEQSTTSAQNRREILSGHISFSSYFLTVCFSRSTRTQSWTLSPYNIPLMFLHTPLKRRNPGQAKHCLHTNILLMFLHTSFKQINPAQNGALSPHNSFLTSALHSTKPSNTQQEKHCLHTEFS